MGVVYEKMENVKLSAEQARAAGLLLYRDIGAYIKAHKNEYQKFLENEKKKDKSKTLKSDSKQHQK
jgi:hypothetical protein